MGSLTIAETLAREAVAISKGWSEERLLDLAGEQLGWALGCHFPQAGKVVGYLGKGHNAGDTLVALRVLRDEFGWEIAVRHAYPYEQWAVLTRNKWLELGACEALDQRPETERFGGTFLLLDGLLGSGGKGELRGPLIPLAAEMEALRTGAGARVAAVDLPSGIDPDEGEVFSNTVTANITFMIGNAKRGLLTHRAARAVGALALVPVEPLTDSGVRDVELIAPQSLEFGKPVRAFDFHKGMAGRVHVFAGSENFPGAAALAATGALRGGAGLVTLWVMGSAVARVAALCPPEVMVRQIQDPRELLDLAGDALVVGPGLGEMDDSSVTGLIGLIAKCPAPMVVDADALNHLARTGNLGVLDSRHVVTPHPGEFARLAPDLQGVAREVAARRFCERVPATLLLKGCRTLVTRERQPLWCNGTGTPGMATGGQGDLLAGVIGARLAGGDSPVAAASLGAWLCGRAAEVALNERHLSEDSLLPSDVLHFLGAAFRDWRTCRR
jgi:hydroxyethylthiazole kinase-like uncharacterized protein yjeF